MRPLYQWLNERATFFHKRSSSQAYEGSVRTEVTVQQQERTLLVCHHGLPAGSACPLCGQTLPLAAETTGPEPSGSQKLKVAPRRLR